MIKLKYSLLRLLITWLKGGFIIIFNPNYHTKVYEALFTNEKYL